MCGIAGILNFSADEISAPLLQAMSDRIEHRGPDDAGIHQEPGVGLVHRRLSILDLSAAGHQPMASQDGTRWLVFNGEIYNYLELIPELKALGYEFRTRTDTEVVLHAFDAWGPACLTRFNGMFAFALWDRARGQLFCARDRLGVKPFYYRQEGARFWFASEIKALLVDPAMTIRPREEALFRYLAFNETDAGDETCFEGISSLLPGHYLVLDRDGLRRHRYWELDRHAPTLHDPVQAAKGFYELFEDAVRLRLRSDVPVGTLLSGGLDSSAIVCVASRLLGQEPVRTFSSCFEDKRFDERDYIEEVVAATRAQATYIYPAEDDLFGELRELVWHQDEPFMSTSVYAQYRVFREVGRHAVKVILDGQGADELVAGYHGYFPFLLADHLRRGRWAAALAEGLQMTRVHGIGPRGLWLRAGRHALGGLAEPLKRRYKRQEPGVKAIATALWDRYEDRPAPAPHYESLLKNELHELLVRKNLPALLRYEDRNSMAFSIESRTPFLDYRLVEYSFALDEELKLKDATTKRILRDAMQGVLPERIRMRMDKLGFVTPQQEWLRGPLRSQVLEILGSESFGDRGLVDPHRARAAFEAYSQGDHDLHWSIWRWVNLELWWRQMVDQRGVRPAREVVA